MFQNDRVRHRVWRSSGRAFRLVLLAGVLAAPALGQQIVCIDIYVPTNAFVGNGKGYLLHSLREFGLYSNQQQVGTFYLQNESQNIWSVDLNNDPWITANNPNGLFSTADAASLVNQLCPNGVQPAGTPAPTTSAQPRAAVQSAAPAPSGRAAGMFAYGDFNGARSSGSGTWLSR